MKVNVLRIDDSFVDVTYNMDYKKLICDNELYLEREDGSIFEYIKIENIYQDEFNNLRMTLADGCKYIITLSCPIDLNKDLKTQQVKEVFERVDMDGNDMSITLQCDGRFLAYIGCGDMYVDGYTSEDNESLEDFILRIREPYIDKQQYISK